MRAKIAIIGGEEEMGGKESEESQNPICSRVIQGMEAKARIKRQRSQIKGAEEIERTKETYTKKEL